MFGWLIPIGNCLFNFVKHLSSVAQFLFNISWRNCDIPWIGQMCWKKWWYGSDMKEMFAIICVNVILSLTAGRTEINVLFGRSTLNLIFNFFVYTWARIRWGGAELLSDLMKIDANRSWNQPTLKSVKMEMDAKVQIQDEIAICCLPEHVSNITSKSNILNSEAEKCQWQYLRNTTCKIWKIHGLQYLQREPLFHPASRF